jgi:hypothetical protein
MTFYVVFSHVGNLYVFSGVKQPMREVDHSPSSSVEIENGGAIPPCSHRSSYRST